MKTKNLKCGALLGALLLGLAGLRANAQPSIFHCTESASPGDVISLQGDSFGNSPQIWMLHVTGTESSLTPKTQLTVLSGNGSLNATGSNSCVTALIPASETPGLYAIWVSSDGGSTFGPGIYINQAAPWNADDLCGSAVDPNRQFHLYGRNLQFSGTGTPTVSFVSGSTSLSATVTSGTDPYVLSVTAPAGLTGGVNYTLNVSNGFGGSYGIVAGPTLTGTITSGTDPFGLGVPWGADFASFPSRVYTVPFVSSTTDMTSAIQTAINAVSGSGGGIVALQSGTYKLSPGTAGGAYSFLMMKSNAVIQGAGMNQTVLLMSGTSTSDPIGYHFGLYDAGATLIDCGLLDLTLYNTATGGSSNLSFPHANHDKFFALRTQFKADVANNIVYSGSQVVINNCVITGGTGAWVLSGTTLINDAGSPVNYSGVVNAIFKNNFFQYYNGRIWLSNGGAGMLVQSNTFSRIAFCTALGESGGLGDQQSQDTVVLGNLFQKDPTLSGTYNIVQNNDGETIMNQTGHNNYPCHGYVSGATSTTLTDTAQNWTCNYAAPGDNGMYYVTIVTGPGTGQIRKVISNGTNTLTVDNPWQVIPGSGSVYSVNHIESLRHLIKDNTLNNCVQGIVYYSISIKDTAIVNNTLNDNGGIYLRADYRPPTTNRFQVQMDTVVSGNSVTRTLNNPYTWSDSYAYIGDWLFLTGTDHAPGTSAYCMEFRGNTVTAPVPSQKSGLGGEGFCIVPVMNNGYALSDGTTVAAVGTIFQGNTAVSCSNAFHLCTGDYYTTLWNNVVSGTGATLLYDGTGSGISHGSMDNTYGTMTGFWNFNSQNGQDSSGNLNNGTPINSPVFSTDVPFSTSGNTYSVQFTGSNRIEVPSSAIINPGNELTVTFWMKSGTNGYGYGRLISKDGESTSSPGWLVQRNNGGTSIAIRIDTNAGTNQMTTITNVLDNTWHYIAFVVNNGSVTAYKDGAQVATRTYNVGGGFMNTGVPLEIGSGNAGSGLLTGMVDEVRLFDAALSSSQISALYNTR